METQEEVFDTIEVKNEWPHNNVKGNCLCGHETFSHMNNNQCTAADCQCVSYALDRWGTL